LITYSHSSTKSENLPKIGPIDIEIIGLIEIAKNKYKEINKKQRQNISPPSTAAWGELTNRSGV